MEKLDSYKKASNLQSPSKIEQTRISKNRRNSGKNIKFGKSSRF